MAETDIYTPPETTDNDQDADDQDAGVIEPGSLGPVDYSISFHVRAVDGAFRVTPQASVELINKRGQHSTKPTSMERTATS
jgi:hypothetical protein